MKVKGREAVQCASPRCEVFEYLEFARHRGWVHLESGRWRCPACCPGYVKDFFQPGVMYEDADRERLFDCVVVTPDPHSGAPCALGWLKTPNSLTWTLASQVMSSWKSRTWALVPKKGK